MKVVEKRKFSWNFVAIGIVVALTVISLINLRNADYYSGDIYHQKQIIWYLLGYVVAAVVTLVDLRLLERLSLPLYAILNLLLLLCLLVGKEVNNAKRWIEIAGINFQPSEYMKIALILFEARLLSKVHKHEYHTFRQLWHVLLAIALPIALILAEPDLGTSILILLVAFSMIFYEGVRLKSVMLLIGIFLLVFPLSWKFGLIREYQKDRIRLWLNPEAFKWDPKSKRLLEKTLQPEQALWAVGAGGFFGKGSKKGSKTRLKYLPEMQTDFIIATYAEEQGFLGCSLLLALYTALFLWGLYVAKTARSRYGVLVAVGVTAYLFWQTFMNLGMVLGLLPVVGITLPFMSYGGSSLLSVMIGVGLLMNIAFFKGHV